MTFEELYKIDVNENTETKKTGNTRLKYLSWSFAWKNFVEAYPTATYEVVKNGNGLPYFDDNGGAMVFTKVTANNLTHEMWLPVMNGANKAMKKEQYSYFVKGYNGAEPTEKFVEPYTMFDINKTIMRCLVKNLAMFGLGLYIYAGEDMPSNEGIVEATTKNYKMLKDMTPPEKKQMVADFKEELIIFGVEDENINDITMQLECIDEKGSAKLSAIRQWLNSPELFESQIKQYLENSKE